MEQSAQAPLRPTWAAADVVFGAAGWSAAGSLQVNFFPVLSAICSVRSPNSGGGCTASPANNRSCSS